MHRFFVEGNQISEEDGRIFITDKEDVNHLVKALRVKIGELIEVSDKIEFEYVAKVVDMDKSQVTCQVMEKSSSERESDVNITLFQGVPKSGKMDLIVQKAVELGVKKIVPLKTKRIVSVFKDSKGEQKKIERWQKICDEAAKQSKRGRLPQISKAITIKELDLMVADFDRIFIAYEKESKLGLKKELEKLKRTNTDSNHLNIGIVIGPEGGLTEDEVGQLVEAGGVSVTLGKRILRTETAGLVCITIVQYELGDLSNTVD